MTVRVVYSGMEDTKSGGPSLEIGLLNSREWTHCWLDSTSVVFDSFKGFEIVREVGQMSAKIQGFLVTLS